MEESAIAVFVNGTLLRDPVRLLAESSLREKRAFGEGSIEDFVFLGVSGSPCTYSIKWKCFNELFRGSINKL